MRSLDVCFINLTEIPWFSQTVDYDVPSEDIGRVLFCSSTINYYEFLILFSND